MKRRKERNPVRWILLTGLVVLFFTLGNRRDTFAYACALNGQIGAYYMVSTAALLMGIFGHSILHEAGHLVFGLLSGYRFSFFRIFSFMLMREDGRFILRRYAIPGTAGQCMMAPPPFRDGKMPVVLYNMGGCIINLLTSLMCFLLAGLAPRAGALEWSLWIWGVISLYAGLSNAIPQRLKVGANDGSNTCSLLQDTEARWAFWLTLEINHRILQGQSLTGMPAEWFAMPEQEQMKNAMIANRAVSYVGRLLEEGRTEEADILMAELIVGDNAIFLANKGLMQMNRLWLELMGQNRPEVVAQLRTNELKKTMKLLRKFPEVIRMEYALAVLVDHDPKKAKKCLDRFARVARKYAYRLTVEQERKAIQMVVDKNLSLHERKNMIG